MIIHYQPTAGKRYVAVVRRLRRVCASVNSLEELVLCWCGRNRRTIVTASEDLDFPALTVSFFLRKKLIGLATIPANDLIRRCEGYEPLNETIIPFCDKEGYRPDDPWFEARSRRLGIDYRSDIEMNYAPPASLRELILSYSLSTYGYAEIDPMRASSDEGKPTGIQLTLVFLGGENKAGWCEIMGLGRGELVEYINSRAPSVMTQVQ